MPHRPIHRIALGLAGQAVLWSAVAVATLLPALAVGATSSQRIGLVFPPWLSRQERLALVLTTGAALRDVRMGENLWLVDIPSPQIRAAVRALPALAIPADAIPCGGEADRQSLAQKDIRS